MNLFINANPSKLKNSFGADGCEGGPDCQDVEGTYQCEVLTGSVNPRLYYLMGRTSYEWICLLTSARHLNKKYQTRSR